MNDLPVCENCHLCKELIQDSALHKAYCLLVRQVVSSAAVDCPSAITDDDIKAAREEYLGKKSDIGHDDLSARAEDLVRKYKVVVEKIKLRDEMAKVEADILRVKLAREKLRLDKEQAGMPTRGTSWLSHVAQGFERWKMQGDLVFGRIKPLPSQMQTFLCENCGGSVQVCEESIGKRVHWKCMACHQQNCFEVHDVSPRKLF